MQTFLDTSITQRPHISSIRTIERGDVTHMTIGVWSALRIVDPRKGISVRIGRKTVECRQRSHQLRSSAPDHQSDNADCFYSVRIRRSDRSLSPVARQTYAHECKDLVLGGFSHPYEK